MNEIHEDLPFLLNSFVKVAQNFALITPYQNLWKQMGKIISITFKIDFFALVLAGKTGKVQIKFTNNKQMVNRFIDKTKEIINSVEKNGFMAIEFVNLEEKYSTAFLPIEVDNSIEAVMIAGQKQEVIFPKITLNVFLAIAGLSGTCIERKRAEKYYRDLVETINEWVWEVDQEGIYTYVSPRIKELLGYEPKEVIGKTSFDLMPPDEAERVVKLFGGIIDSQESFERLENIKIHKDGRRIMLETSGVPIFDTERNFLGYRGIDLNITERKQIEKALRQSKEKYQMLVEKMDEGVLLEDTKGLISFVNPRIVEMLGYTENELLGKHWNHFYAKKDLGKVTIESKKHSKKVSSTYETSLLAKDGNLIPVIVTATSLLSKHEKYEGVLCVFTDITERKIAEEALVKARNSLAEKVEERTKELFKANIKLKELDNLKSMFLASMSHELRTPLNSIIGFTKWLLMGMEGELNEKQTKQLNMVKSSAIHLLDLITDILDISKIEAGKVDLASEKFEIAEVVNEVVTGVLPLAQDKGLNLISNVPEGVILTSDKRRIKQIIINLTSNAIKFTDQGDVKIEVKLLNNKDLEFVVSDSGIGIKKKDLEKLFQPFQQIDMSSTKKHQGTGLGLYLCKKLLDLFHGDISVTSHLGKGSEFKFIIPINFKEEI